MYNGCYNYSENYDGAQQQQVMGPTGELCPYMANGDCPYGVTCQYVHGDICDMCQCAVLSPFDPEQRQQHELVIGALRIVCTWTLVRFRWSSG